MTVINTKPEFFCMLNGCSYFIKFIELFFFGNCICKYTCMYFNKIRFNFRCSINLIYIWLNKKRNEYFRTMQLFNRIF